MVSFLIAVYFKRHGKSVTIVSPSSILSTQLETELYKVKKDSSGIEVVTPKLMSKAHHKMNICIVDEADYIVEEKNFVFLEQDKELVMNGACRAYQAEKIIFMSARFND